MGFPRLVQDDCAGVGVGSIQWCKIRSQLRRVVRRHHNRLARCQTEKMNPEFQPNRPVAPLQSEMKGVTAPTRKAQLLLGSRISEDARQPE